MIDLNKIAVEVAQQMGNRPETYEGWVLVPRKEDESMRIAYREASPDGDILSAEGYKAMLSAAPTSKLLAALASTTRSDVMTDKKLLELAAKAAGYVVGFKQFSDELLCWNHTLNKEWDPLTDDGDALRLAVKLEMEMSLSNGKIFASTPSHNIVIQKEEPGIKFDPCAATRRAIVRAAAEIGKGMK